MKRLLSFATAAMVVLSMSAFAEYHTSTATTLITVDVQIPMLVLATPSNLDLGDLAPGVTRLLGTPGTLDVGPTGPAVLFTVNGAYGWPFTVVATDPVDINPAPLNGLVHLNGSWYNGSDNVNWVPGVTPPNPLDPFFYLGHDVNGVGIGNHELIPNLVRPTDGLPTPGGYYYFMYGVESMRAEDLAVVGTYSFEITLTAAYANVNIDLTGYPLVP